MRNVIRLFFFAPCKVFYHSKNTEPFFEFYKLMLLKMLITPTGCVLIAKAIDALQFAGRILYLNLKFAFRFLYREVNCFIMYIRRHVFRICRSVLREARKIQHFYLTISLKTRNELIPETI